MPVPPSPDASTPPADPVAVDAAANQGGHGANTLAEPTEAQKLTGDYEKGRLLFGRDPRFPCEIENPRDTFRTGTGPNGPWCQRMPAHYGYIAGTRGNDGDEVDCFIGQNLDAGTAFVINQDNRAGVFDEHKVVLGVDSEQEARALYFAAYTPGWKGLHSVAAVDLPQLRWWLRHGDMSQRLVAAHLPKSGTDMDKKVLWDSAVQPIGSSVARVLYSMRITDSEQLLGEAMEPGDLDRALGEATVAVFDGIVSTKLMLEKKMNALMRIMSIASPAAVMPTAVVIGEPKLRRMLGGSTVNVDVIFSLADGQTVTICFHNPDSTPTRLLPGDELISWKWLLNKRDVTIVVAPERGVDLNVREVARRILALADRNHDLFERVNVGKDERAKQLSALRDEAATLDAQLLTLADNIIAARQELEQAKLPRSAPAPALGAAEEAAFREAGASDSDVAALAAAGGYAAILADEAKGRALQDVIDHLLQTRLIAIRNALRDLGWSGEQYQPLSKAGTMAVFSFVQIGAGANIVAIAVNGLSDTMTTSAGAFAAEVDAALPAPVIEPAPGVEPVAEVQSFEKVEETVVSPPPVIEATAAAAGDAITRAEATARLLVVGGWAESAGSGEPMTKVSDGGQTYSAWLKDKPDDGNSFYVLIETGGGFHAEIGADGRTPEEIAALVNASVSNSGELITSAAAEPIVAELAAPIETQEPVVAVATGDNETAAAELAAALAQAAPPPAVPAEPLTVVETADAAEPLVLSEATPAAEPPAATLLEEVSLNPPEQRDIDTAYLLSVQTGDVGYDSPDIAARIEEIHARYPGDEAMTPAITAAVDAYQSFVTAAARTLLSA